MVSKVVDEYKADLSLLLKGAEKVGEIAESEALEADQNKTVSKNVIDAIKEARLSKLLLPKKYGEPQVDLREYSQIIRTVGKYNTSAAWLTFLYSIHNSLVAFMTKEGAEEVINQGGLIADIFAPIGKVEKDGDGFRITGKYSFVSGILYSDWVALAVKMKLDDSEETELCMLNIPISDVEIVENWDTLGLRGTGSNQVIVDNVYVPKHHLIRLTVADRTGRPPQGYDKDYPLYDVPFFSSFSVGFPMVALGGAERLLQEFKNRTEKRVRMGGNSAKDSRHQGVLAELTIKYYESEGLLDKYISLLENYEMGKEDKRGEFAAIRAKITKNVTDIAVKVLLTLGGFSMFKGDPIEIFVRDLLAVCTHRSNLYEDSVESFGKTQFGFDVSING
ncbi:acyl-CoA dehydrogenase [Neobacillus drentensis]|uniref:acyl-CoA dehydrogenase n=1 Tax=Neobacillus drentensis TaxID=220684 RepID=UPI00285C8907|nr:acyl-CoA dehydrogenase [Neobacillus drentensis]MDR7236351.1 3-hydroxy-9,10-secoandrosta-1,3,5(10)-triene-9,17-dione monooxygenase [Neobacillus drentensis]